MENVVSLIRKAIHYDEDGRRMEALKMYESAISQLLQRCKADIDAKEKETIRQRIEEYLKRAETLKKQIAQLSTKGELIDKIFIMEGASGYSYDKVFGKYLNEAVKEVWLEEPYIVEHYQICNLVQFCELIVTKCRNLRYINVTTTAKKTTTEQNGAFELLIADLKSKNITLNIEFNEHTHDRQIILSNGYIIKIGRGLNYFKPTSSKYSLGLFDYSFRSCRQTNVDIFYCPENKK